MSKNKKHQHDHHRGEIKDNAIKALVTSVLFKSKVEKPKKGKGSFQRNSKHKGREPYLKAA
ncbi:MAG: alternative ribosome rescue factor ArfA [Colwellia sp.]|uniref:alternative ribosome rescue factor ArfA n=1 Tax=Pseudoalteromonas phenolica TaxID=161398 RepID=UPI0038505E89|tara:strand:+ start:184 stop:366 length:183 start_codon:yes stop_codon:yes gene_type:complete